MVTRLGSIYRCQIAKLYAANLRNKNNYGIIQALIMWKASHFDFGLDFLKKGKRNSRADRLESEENSWRLGREQVHSVPGSGAGVGECEGPAGMSTACVRNRKVSGWGPWFDGGREVGRAGAPRAAAVHVHGEG